MARGADEGERGEEADRGEECDRGEEEAFRLPRLPGRLNALVSDGQNPRPPAPPGGVRDGEEGAVAGEERDPPRAARFPSGLTHAGFLVLLSFWRLSTASRWLWVSLRIFWASSWGSSSAVGTRSSWDLMVLSVSVLDWSDSELHSLPFLSGDELEDIKECVYRRPR